MKRTIAALALVFVPAFTLSPAALSPAQAQALNLQFQAPLNYRFSVLPKSHVFFYNRHRHHHGWRHRHHRRQYLPLLAGPSVIYRDEVEMPPQRVTAPAVPIVAHPVVHRIGETGPCGVERINVSGSRGRTNVNIWRC